MWPAWYILNWPESPICSLSVFSLPLFTVNTPSTITFPVNVETPTTLTLSKFVWPSTSKSALTSILPLNVEIPETSNLLTSNWLVLTPADPVIVISLIR